MSVSYFVRYSGRAADPEGFLKYYETAHSSVLWRMPGLRSLRLHVAEPWKDPFPVTAGGDLLLAQMEFDDIDALNAALASPARAEAREDFVRFPKFDGEVRHQAMLTRRIMR